MTKRLQLTLNVKKTSIRNARREPFDFLGYTFGPRYSPKTGEAYIGYGPSNKSVGRITEPLGNCKSGTRCPRKARASSHGIRPKSDVSGSHARRL